MSKKISYMTVGDRIRYYRRLFELSQEEFADLMDTTPESVSHLESGKRIPSLELGCKMADFFGISLDLLYRGLHEPEAAEIKEDGGSYLSASGDSLRELLSTCSEEELTVLRKLLSDNLEELRKRNI